MTPQQEQQIGQYVNLLNEFIDIATRWPVEALRASVADQSRFGMFDYHVSNAVGYQDGFFQSLRCISDDSWRAWEVSIRSILPTLDLYLRWYHEHENEVNGFDPYNPYRLMNGHIEGTKGMILQYFPDLAIPDEKKKRVNQEQMDSLTLKDVVKPERWDDLMTRILPYIDAQTKHWTEDIYKLSGFLYELHAKDYLTAKYKKPLSEKIRKAIAANSFNRDLSGSVKNHQKTPRVYITKIFG
jgi:hypothetical protein